MKRKLQNNYIIGIMGKKGSGKSEFMKSCLDNIPRVIIIDPFDEYVGTICESWHDVIDVLDDHRELHFRIVYRNRSDEDLEDFLGIINSVNNYTLVFEEVDIFSDSRSIHPELLRFTKYGRHFYRSLIWISRNPYEISRFLTRNSDVLITFTQTEPRDLEYMNEYTFNKDIESLKEFEWAFCGDEQIITEILKKEVSVGGVIKT